MAAAPSQFRVLYRDFLFRVLDIELLPAVDDIQRLLAQFGAMLAAFSFTVAVFSLPKYIMSNLPHAKLLVAARGEQEFLIATTMAIAGLFSVLAWNNVLPARRDCLVLGILPVRARTIFLAKTAALGAALGVSVLALNLFTGVAMPLLVAGEGLAEGLRAMAAYWVAVSAAALFVCSALVALQGVITQVLPYRVSLRVSSLLQFAAFFAVLGFYVLKPAFPATEQIAPAAHGWESWLPSFWFFAIFQMLNGARAPEFQMLAARGWWALAIAAGTAAVSLGLAYGRAVRNIVEQPDIAPSDRSRPAARLARRVANLLLPRPIDRAVLLFTARTIARSRQHRLLLAAYGGIGLAIAMAYVRDLLYGASSFERYRMHEVWYLPNFPLLAGSLVLLFFAITGARAVFALPVAAGANWAWRMTAVHSPSAYFGAVRKALYTLAALPVWLLAAALFFSIWPAAQAAGHIAILGAAAVLTVELTLHRFRKVPFACSYLPGAANIHVRLGVFGIAFFFVTALGVPLEWSALHSLAGFAMLFGVLCALAVWARRRTTAWETASGNFVQFDEVPPADVEPLNLHQDGGWSGGTYIDLGRPLPAVTPTLFQSFGAPPVERPPFSPRAGAEQLLKDLRFGARILWRSPGFSAAAIALVALGIGGNVTIYSMIHGVLTKPAGGVNAEGLVSIAPAIAGHVMDPGENSFLNYLAYADQVRSMSSILAAEFERFTVGTNEGTFELRGQLVSANFFDTLGLRMAKGRTFTPDEARGAAPLAAIIAYHVWQNQFQGAPDVLGRTVVLNGHPATIVGVGPRGFTGAWFAPTAEVCVPLIAYTRLRGSVQQLTERGADGIMMIGRLAPGVSLARAQSEFDAVSRQLEDAFPIDRGRLLVLAPYSATAFGPNSGPQMRFFMGILMAVALVTLLIVCANVANLMLGRSALRQREMAVRQSLGAGQGRILRMVMFEGLVLSVVAAGAAVLFAEWVTHAVVTLIPPLESGARMTPDLTPDWRVAGYAMLLAVMAALAFTLAPALRSWRQDLLPWLKAGEHSVVRGRSRLAGCLAAAQIALGVVLLTSAGLATRSMALIDTTDLYFNKDHLLLAGIDTSGVGAAPDQNLALLERMRDRLQAVPGVVSVSWALGAPPNSHPWSTVAQAAGSNHQVNANAASVGPDYLQALGVPVREGRGIALPDLQAAQRVAVVTRNLEQAVWPGESAVGRTLLLDNGRIAVQVVGVVPDGAFSGVGRDGSFAGLGKEHRDPFLFLCEQAAVSGPGQRTIHIRYTGALGPIPPAVRAAIHEVDSRVPVFSVRTMQQEWDDFTLPVRFIARLVAFFAAGALLLAGIGLYAVIAFYTAGRRRELGIRMALGATPRQAMGTVMRDGLLLTALGLCAGLALNAGVARVLRSYLVGISATDIPTYAATLGLLGAAALLACYIPGRRAAAIEPGEALRED